MRSWLLCGLAATLLLAQAAAQTGPRVLTKGNKIELHAEDVVVMRPDGSSKLIRAVEAKINAAVLIQDYSLVTALGEELAALQAQYTSGPTGISINDIMQATEATNVRLDEDIANLTNLMTTKIATSENNQTAALVCIPVVQPYTITPGVRGCWHALALSLSPHI